MVRSAGAVADNTATTKPIKELSVEEWVLAEVEKAGLNSHEAYAIIKCESNFNPLNVNYKSDDYGLWQINKMHFNENFTVADALDYKKATEWAIAKRIHDNSWSAWVCADLLHLK
jgi:hypothetical protein